MMSAAMKFLGKAFLGGLGGGLTYGGLTKLFK